MSGSYDIRIGDEPTAWTLVQSHADHSGVIATWGVFSTEEAATAAAYAIERLTQHSGLIEVIPHTRLTAVEPDGAQGAS